MLRVLIVPPTGPIDHMQASLSSMAACQLAASEIIAATSKKDRVTWTCTSEFTA
jgi:hypothetical protein